jgi:hypothetical protein
VQIIEIGTILVFEQAFQQYSAARLLRTHESENRIQDIHRPEFLKCKFSRI